MKEYIRRNRASFIGALIFVLISTAFAVALQFFKGDVLDSAIAGDVGGAVGYALKLAGFILCEVGFYYLYTRCWDAFAVGCLGLLKRDIFKSVISRDFVAFKKRPVGEYIAKYTSEADLIRSRYFQMLPKFWEILFKIILVSAALFLLDWRIALITIALLTTPLYVPKLIERRLQRAQNEFFRASEDDLAKLNDWLNGLETVKNYSIEDRILSKFDVSSGLVMEKLLRDTKLGAAAQLITTLISYLSYFIVLAAAAALVLSGRFSAGDFFVAVGMIDQLSYPLISMAEVIRQLLAIRPALRSMEEFISQGRPEGRGRTLTGVEDGIRYDRVSFAYGEGREILRGFSFTFRMGGRYLIKGPSGCGKTTAINLLLRYFDTGGGEILIDGVPIGEYGDVFGSMTVVRQDATLFNDTLRDNLTMYRDMPDEKLTGLLEKLGLERFTGPGALDTVVSEDGANLSGGEKRRICLARALLRDTDVLLLDEPLANLDDATAGKVEDLLLDIRGKLVIIVSHRFSEEKLSDFDGVIDLVEEK